MTTLRDIARTLGVIKPSREEKLAAILDDLSSVEVRMDLEWNESDHPRAADGKFGSGGGGSVAHGAKSYIKSLAGKKGSGAGMIKHMLQAGTYSKADIIAATKEVGFNLGGNPSYAIEAYHKQMMNPPPIPAKSGPKEVNTPTGTDPDGSFAAHGKKILAEIEAAKAAKAAVSGKSAQQQKAVASLTSIAELPDEKKTEKFKDAAYKYLPSNIFSAMKPTLDHFENLTAENKPKVESKLMEVLTAFAENEGSDTDTNDIYTALMKIDPIAGSGMSVNAVNTMLVGVKADYASKANVTGYAPTSEAEKKVYSKLSKVAHYATDSGAVAEDHEGKDIKARLKTSTKAIPGDYYAKVSSAYNGKKNVGDTPHVGSAMQDYGNEVWNTFDEEQRGSLDLYKGSGYMSINQALLSENFDEYASSGVKSRIKNIDAAMAKSVVPADTPVFRGMTATLKDLTGFDDPDEAVGRAFEHKNYASVSRNIEVSKNFGSTTMLRFTIPAGANGIVLGSQSAGEKEIVLPRRGVFRVDKVTGNMVDVTYLGVREDD
jgi:hypothetical protein